MFNLLNRDYITSKIPEQDINAFTNNDSAPDKLELLMSEAGAYIDLMLSDIYDLSGVVLESENFPSKQVLTRIQFEIFKYFLYQMVYDDEQMKAVVLSYQEQLNMLERIRNGSITLAGIPRKTRKGIAVTSPSQVFTKCRLESYDN